MKNKTSKRILELDGIRGLAILMVVAYHYISVPLPQNGTIFSGIIKHVLGFGWTGVDLFFVLSGFLIGGILIDHKYSENYFQIFYIRRICRIFPLYFFFLGIQYLLLKSNNNLGVFSPGLFENNLPGYSYVFFIQNFYMAAAGSFGNDHLGMTWSLAIEEQFYLFLPFLVRKSRPDRLPLNFGFLILLPLILRNTLGSGFYGFVLTPWRLDSLMLGAMLALIYRTPMIWKFLHKNINWVKWIFFLTTAMVTYVFFTEGFGALGHYFMWGLFYTLLLYFALKSTSGFWARMLRNSFLRTLGGISFGIYLFHSTVNWVLHDIFLHTQPAVLGWETVLVTLLSFIVTVSFAAGTYQLFEKRAVRFGHSFKYQMKTKTAQV